MVRSIQIKSESSVSANLFKNVCMTKSENHSNPTLNRNNINVPLSTTQQLLLQVLSWNQLGIPFMYKVPWLSIICNILKGKDHSKLKILTVLLHIV